MCTVDKMYQDGNALHFLNDLWDNSGSKGNLVPGNAGPHTDLLCSEKIQALRTERYHFELQICQIVSIYHHRGVFICKMGITRGLF